MSLLEASSILAMLVGLLCNWKQERGAMAQDRFQDFMTWLEQHHFNDLKARIISSDELQRELNLLLKEDLASISTKLDSITSGVVAISSKLDHFAAMARVLGASADELSDQATELLKRFAESQASYLFPRQADPQLFFHVVFQPSNRMWKLREPKFLGNDLRALENFKFLQWDEREDAYTLTRLGAEFAKRSTVVTGHMTEHHQSLDYFRSMVGAG